MASIVPSYLDSVFAVGLGRDDGTPEWIATAFAYGYFLRDAGPGQDENLTYLVTNRHVLQRVNAEERWLRCNSRGTDQPAVVVQRLVDEQGRPLWRAHSDPAIDVAVLPLNVSLLQEKGMTIDYFHERGHAAVLSQLREMGLSEGDGVFVLGFPMGLVGDQYNAVIVRRGCVARIRDALRGHSKEFLLDAFVFPGNSGGPVVLEPAAGSIEGTQAINKALLIGIVKTYVPYREMAVSEQTGEPRIMFVENSGLAAAHPIDYVNEIIEAHVIEQGKPELLDERKRQLDDSG